MTVTAFAVPGPGFLRDRRLGLCVRDRAAFGDWTRYHDIGPRHAEAPGHRWARLHHAESNRGNCDKAEASGGHLGISLRDRERPHALGTHVAGCDGPDRLGVYQA